MKSRFYLILISILLLFVISCEKENLREQNIVLKDGKIMTGYLINGKKNGIWKIWYGKGQIYAVGSFNNNKLDGKWLYFDKNGRLEKSEFFINGLKFGRAYEYYNDGRIATIINFVNDTLNGSFISYTYKNNYIKCRIEYFEKNKIVKKGKCYMINIENCNDDYFNNNIGLGLDVLELNSMRN